MVKKNIRIDSLFGLPFCFLIVVFLAGCLVPENFVATVRVDRDGGYNFKYDGTMAFLPAVAESKKGKNDDKNEKELVALGQKVVKEDSSFKEYRYIGNGRYKVLAEKVGLPGESYFFMSKGSKFFSIQPGENGTIKISGFRPSAQVVSQLSSLGVKINGKLSVSVPWGAKIIKHNADQEPFFFGLFGSYIWAIDKPDADPNIIIKL
ncbi:hypothetical protein EST62_05590 [Chlorobaculum sp. 24CR]|uniref:hypothetical protein n=1 Tax=Chlorobaculum sp. 24CR TaxID=2508878 RepID=UPI00100AF7FE|nr:hypothetical protein [Chlorobaculum sp. 24CR]RXK87982.1 hypothetical protein EST62_05590 [Chlorobaculum sp. 24CR]